jgi:DNA-directed RNA polymerase subunit beta
MTRRALKDDEIQDVEDKDIDYEVLSPNQFYGSHLNLIPLQSAVQGARLFYGSKFVNQTMPLKDPEVPWVQNAMDGDPEGRSFDDVLGKNAGAVFSDRDGVVESVEGNKVMVRGTDGQRKTFTLYNNMPFNRKSSIHNTPVVKKGDVLKTGQVIAKSNYTDDKGTLAMGLNAEIALVPYKGFSFEDAIVISEDFAKRLTSEHMYTDDMEYKRGIRGGLNHFKSMFPQKFTNDQYAKLDKEGVIKVGQEVQHGDPIALATAPKAVSSESARLGKLSSHMKNARNDSSLVWEHHNPGIVTDVVRTKNGVKVAVKSFEPLAPGDKVVMRAGQKGVVSKIVPTAQMPRHLDGSKIDVLFNPQGMPSRNNASAVYELLLGKIAKKLGKPYKIPSFTPAGQTWHQFVSDELKKYGINETEEIFDPQANRKLRQPVTTGQGYIWKLHHTSQKGFSARSQGAYDVNEQPLKGGDEAAKSKRLSGLEAHALLSAGATGVLKDMTLVRGAKNDDYWQQLRSGYDPKMPDTPFAYNKFKALLQGAGYHARSIRKGTGMRLGPLTEKILDELNPMEVHNPDIVDVRKFARGTVEAVKGGLFDDVMTAGNRYGYIRLPFEMVNPAFEEPVRKILGLTEKQFRAIMAGEEELPPALQERLKKFAKKADTAPAAPQTTMPAPIQAPVTSPVKPTAQKANLGLKKYSMPPVKQLNTGAGGFNIAGPVGTNGVRG